jgi:hypothetical protein
MSEDETKKLTDRQLLELIRRDLADVKARLATVEAFVEDRSRDTRPLLGQIQKELTDTRTELSGRLETLEGEVKTIRRELGLLREDIRNERLARVESAERIEDLERKPS